MLEDASIWDNTYDSSWIARDLTQTLALLDGSTLFHQIGQFGINVALVIYEIFFVYHYESEQTP